ncbi:hypothetical protein DF039_36985 [Burkholderia cenocepacia]|nr:hypothetical protein DF039_36985 [Burkholderia cenocepacia]
MANTTVQMMTVKDSEPYEGSGNAELVIGFLFMLAGIGLFVYAFQSAVSDLPYTATAWLIGLALGAIGVFVWSNGVRKQRIAGEIAERQSAAQEVVANAETVAAEAIERARKK